MAGFFTLQSGQSIYISSKTLLAEKFCRFPHFVEKPCRHCICDGNKVIKYFDVCFPFFHIRGAHILQKQWHQKVDLNEVSIWSDHPKNSFRLEIAQKLGWHPLLQVLLSKVTT